MDTKRASSLNDGRQGDLGGESQAVECLEVRQWDDNDCRCHQPEVLREENGVIR